MIVIPDSLKTQAPRWLARAALATLALGLGVWVAILSAPSLAPTAAAFHAGAPAQADTSAVAGWFGGKSLMVPVHVSGLLAKQNGSGSAILAVNGGRPQAYRTGERLAPGLTLHQVLPTGVVVNHDGSLETVLAPADPMTSIQGFIPVPAGNTAR